MGDKIIIGIRKYGDIFLRGASKTFDMGANIKVLGEKESASIEKAWKNVGTSLRNSMAEFDGRKSSTRR